MLSLNGLSEVWATRVYVADPQTNAYDNVRDLVGQQGPQGDPGPQGPQGDPTGATGATGPQARRGRSASRGRRAPPGATRP